MQVNVIYLSLNLYVYVYTHLYILHLIYVTFLCNVFYLRSTVIDQLHGPAALILDPNKDPSICITGGQFLEGLIPSHQDHLKDTKKNK